MSTPVTHPSRWSRFGATPRTVLAPAAGNSSIRRLELSLVAFNLAEFGTWVAALVYAYHSGGTAASGVVGFLLLTPAALAAPFAPPLCHRFFGGSDLVAAYTAQSVAYALTGAAMLWSASLPLVVVLAALGSITLVSTRPLITARLPSVAQTPRELTSASLAIGWIEGFGFVAGPAAAGLILLFSGPGLVYLVMALGLIGSALLVARQEPGDAEVPVQSVIVSIRAGLSELVGNRDTTAVASFMAVHYIILGAIDVLLVVLAFRLLHLGQSGFGLLTTAFGVGSVIGATLGLALASEQRLVRGLILGALSWGAGLTLMTVLPGRYLVVLVVVLAGIGRPLITVSGRLLLQRVAAVAALIPLFAVLEGVSMAAIGLGLAVMPPIMSALGDRQTFIAAGLILPVLLAVLFRQFAALERRGILPGERLELLRSIPIFGSLPPVTIDRLARGLAPAVAGPGEAVVRQGERGRLFYIVADGRLSVDVDGKPVRMLAPGDCFGEIALLRDGIRTATVTADVPTYLYALDRSEFLSAVTGHPDSSQAATAVVESRLAEAAPLPRSSSV